MWPFPIKQDPNELVWSGTTNATPEIPPCTFLSFQEKHILVSHLIKYSMWSLCGILKRRQSW